MNNINSDNSNIIIKITKGILIAFAITLISIFVFSIVLTYTNISEKVIPIVIIMITFISIFISTIICVKKIKKNGLINGGIIGGIYVILLYIISSIINTGFNVNIHSIIMIIIGILSGIIGRNNWNKYKIKNGVLKHHFLF